MLIEAGVRSPSVLAELERLPPDLVEFAVRTVGGGRHAAGRIVQALRTGLAGELFDQERTAMDRLRAAAQPPQDRAKAEQERLMAIGRAAAARLDPAALGLRINAYEQEYPHAAERRRRRGERTVESMGFLAWLGAMEDPR